MKIDFPGYAGRTETLTNFPVLVVFSNNVAGSGFDFNTILSEDGYDLRFRDADDTTNLNYEIDQWNPNGVSWVWVQVPELPCDGTGAILAKWGGPRTGQAGAWRAQGTAELRAAARKGPPSLGMVDALWTGGHARLQPGSLPRATCMDRPQNAPAGLSRLRITVARKPVMFPMAAFPIPEA